MMEILIDQNPQRGFDIGAWVPGMALRDLFLHVLEYL